jgi:hypothetical protein
MNGMQVCKGTAVAMLVVMANAVAHETEEKIAAPGFRPESEHAATFIKTQPAAKVAVHPTVIRTVEGTAYSSASQQQVVAALADGPFLALSAEATPLDPGELKGQEQGQYGMFQNDMQTFGAALDDRATDVQYHLILEVLLPPGNRAVFGIHCFVLDRAGRNAFSFLLNSHHQLFVEADMNAADDSPAARTELVRKATEVGIKALQQQIHLAADHPAAAED